MRCFVLVTASWAVAALVLALAIVFGGIYNVSALHGHFPGVSWILHTTYHNSVKRRAPAESAVPDLSDPDMISLGAKHYDQACRFCHAAPGEAQNDTVRAMEPVPPHISQAIGHWKPRHLFWIVRNGVKMSGMPAWPSTIREDDVWNVVAFLEQVRDMDAAQYRALTGLRKHQGDSASADPGKTACDVCHAASANTHIPRLESLDPAYIEASLNAYRAGTRHSGIMRHVATSLNDGEIAHLAQAYASSRRATSGAAPDPALVSLGETLARGSAEHLNVAACTACHGPWHTQRNPRFPELAGQSEGYLFTQLKLLKQGKRGGTPAVRIMHKVVPDLEENQMRALAAYYASLPPAPAKQAGSARRD